MIRFSRLSLRRGSKLLIQEATLLLHHGQRVGITGANGSGKSSLFALIRGELTADAGDLELPPGLVIAHVAQEMQALEQPAIEFVIDGDAELRGIEARLAQAESDDDGERQAELHARMEAVQGYGARSRAARLMHGLGFSTEQEHQPLSTFSGGWRMRLNLAQALMCRSDLLLLDEPTNHLDLDAVIWLEGWLSSYSGTLLLISHDRDFLDGVVTHLLHVVTPDLNLYTGNYSDFERQRAERLVQQQAAWQTQQREIQAISRFVERFRAKATKARQVQSRIKTLERMETLAPAHADSGFHFSFEPPDANPHPLLQLRELAAGYGDTRVLADINLTLSPGDRIGLLGRNGAGKSTLVKVLAGELQPTEGERAGAKDLLVGYFAQHQIEQLRPELSPLQHLQALSSKTKEQTLRNHLGGFGFTGDMALQPTEPFSGGEKARLVLAMLVYRRPNLLLLDEPTNHLDLEMRHALTLALQTFEGAAVLVSHDRSLLRASTDQFLLVTGQTVKPFSGDLDDYRRWLVSRTGGTQPERKPGSDDHHNSAGAKRQRRQLEAEFRRRLQPLRQQLKTLEARLEQLTEKRAALEHALADPGLYADQEKARLRQKLEDRAQITRELEHVEEAWLQAGEQLEAAELESH